MHLSRSTFKGIGEVGHFRLPMTMHVTFCGQKAASHEVVEENEATCIDCISAMCWEEIDRMNCESHPGGG